MTHTSPDKRDALVARIHALICRFRGHLFLGWKDAGEIPGRPLPMAYCARCHKEM